MARLKRVRIRRSLLASAPFEPQRRASRIFARLEGRARRSLTRRPRCARSKSEFVRCSRERLRIVWPFRAGSVAPRMRTEQAFSAASYWIHTAMLHSHRGAACWTWLVEQACSASSCSTTVVCR